MEFRGPTLVINRHGWCVYKPYATGVDTGPARFVARRGDQWTDEMRREFTDTILPYYTRAGYEIKGRMP